MIDGERGAPPAGATATLIEPRTSGDGDGNGEDTLTSAVDAPGPSPAGADGRPHLPYNPALDGIRGIAVAAVLLFHADFSWARGGYLGVSTFFTLSGFLITSLLVAEHHRSGRISLTAFWARRLRRLLPAAALTLFGVVLAVFATNQAWERGMTGDVVSSALNVANWHFLSEGSSYGDQFDPAVTSPVLHFWSLAIEEQFYWLFPLLAAGVLGAARGSLRVFALVLTGLLGVSAVLTLSPGLLGIDQPDADVVYYATPIRMGEILVGALLAVAIARGRVVESARLRPMIVAAGFAALVATAWAWWNIERTSPVLGDGGLLLYAGVSGALVLAACVPGPVRRGLAFEPLRLLGVISYGVYLFHWPIFRLLSEERVDQLLEPLDLHPRGFNLFVIRLVPTLALAIVSYHLLERPIRSGWRPTWGGASLRSINMPLLAGGAVTSVVVAALVVPQISEPPADEFERLEELVDSTPGPDPSTLLPDAKIGITLGDSTMLRTAWGLSWWGGENGMLAIPGGTANIGCGIGRGGEVEYAGEVAALQDDCQKWTEKLRHEIRLARERYGHVDFAVVQTGPWDVANRKVDVDGDGDEEWRHIGQSDYDEYLRDEFEAANDLFLEEGMTVVWLTAPEIEAGRNQDPPPAEPYPESDPERMARLNEMIEDLASAREGVVVVDLAGYVASLPPGEDERLRPDGVHFEIETTGEVSLWLAPRLLLAAETEAAPAS